MSKIDDKDLMINLPDAESEEELGIFGRSLSREEIKAEQKAQRAREIQALRDARRAAKAARRAEPKGKRKDLLIMGAFILAVVVVCGVILGVQIAASNKEALYEASETNTAHFYNMEARPTLDDEGLTAVINEVYYTKGDYLCVNMTLGNGLKEMMTLDSLEVKISNSETKELIASGYTEAIDSTYCIEAQGYNTYTLYIRPEHIKIMDDTLQNLTYEITAVGTTVEE